MQEAVLPAAGAGAGAGAAGTTAAVALLCKFTERASPEVVEIMS